MDRAVNAHPEPDLAVFACPCCDSTLVELERARPLGDGCWALARRCPECQWRGVQPFTTEAFLELTAVLQAARARLTSLLARIS